MQWLDDQVSFGPDKAGLPQSQVDFHVGLPAGDYFAGIGGFNTIFEDDFVVTPGAPGGNYQLNVEGIAAGGILAADELAYIGFTIAPANVDINDCDQDGALGLSDTLCATPFTIERVLSAAKLVQGDADGNGEVEFADFLVEPVDVVQFLSCIFHQGKVHWRCFPRNLRGNPKRSRHASRPNFCESGYTSDHVKKQIALSP